MQEIQLPALVGGRYRPISLIGTGGMSRVYEAEHIRTGQRVALKLLTMGPGTSVERFKREARATSRVSSEHVVRVIDADTIPELGDAPFIVTELLHGQDLSNVLADAEHVVEWLRQVARGLERAHAADIIHRDLKPENLFLTFRDDGRPLIKILDFGVSKLLTADETLTRSDHFLGTPAYMAPEQADSEHGEVTFRTDLFALGLVAHRLLTGRSYWKPGSLSQLLSQILIEAVVPPSARGSTLGAAFDQWFLRACARNPEERFTSACEQIEALAQALGLSQQEASTSECLPQRISSAAPCVSNLTPNAAARDINVRKRPRRGLGWLFAALLAFLGVSSLVVAPLVRDRRRSTQFTDTAVATAANSTLIAERATPDAGDFKATVDAGTLGVAAASPGTAAPAPARRPLDQPDRAVPKAKARPRAHRPSARDPLAEQF